MGGTPLVSQEARRELEQLHNLSIKVGGITWSPEEFRRRVARYEAIVEPLARTFGILGRWGDGSEFSRVNETLAELYQRQDDSGVTALLNLQRYPVVLLGFDVCRINPPAARNP